MSDYSCHKHGHDFHEDCVACEAADDWASQQRRIAELEADVLSLSKYAKKLEAQLTELRDENERLKDENAGYLAAADSLFADNMALLEEGK